ncbi:MAG: hypothetical protein ACJ8AK_06685 [Gemmatimonadaceae bacterium]
MAGCRKPNPRDVAREQLKAIVNDSVGKAGDPKISFVMELKVGPQSYGHLQVEFDTVAFANMADSAFAARSRQIAGLVIRHYSGGPLDSVTVLSHDPIGPGAWRIVRMQTYAVRDLPGKSSSP